MRVLGHDPGAVAGAQRAGRGPHPVGPGEVGARPRAAGEPVAGAPGVIHRAPKGWRRAEKVI